MPRTALIVVIVILVLLLIFQILVYAKIKGFAKPNAPAAAPMSTKKLTTNGTKGCKGCKKRSA